MARFPDLTATARRLLNLEVNTILCAAMTAEPMPAVPHALLDIAGWYAEALVEVSVDLTPYFEVARCDHESVPFAWSKAGSPRWDSSALTVRAGVFDALRWAAKRAARAPEAARQIPPDQAVLLDRIVNNCDAIKQIFGRFDQSRELFENKTRAQLLEHPVAAKSYAVAPDDLAVLQKIWDIGVDEIVAQTIAYITGDVTTRVQESLAKAGSEPILAIHRSSVDVSVNSWKVLLEVVATIAGDLVSAFIGTRK